MKIFYLYNVKIEGGGSEDFHQDSNSLNEISMTVGSK